MPFEFYCDIQYPGHEWHDRKQVIISGFTVASKLPDIMQSPKKRLCSGGSTLCDVVMLTDDNRPFHVRAFVDSLYDIRSISDIYNILVSPFQYIINSRASIDCV